MKKISYLFFIWLLPLASCSQEAINNENEWNQNAQNTVTWTIQNTLTGENIQENQELNSEISVNEVENETAKKVDFTLEYTTPNGQKASLSWNMEVKNGVIVWVWGMEWLAWPQWEFAKWLWDEVIGKEIEWLQIDTISWASLVSYAFNEFLKENY